MERTITKVPITTSVVDRFVAGTTEPDAVEAARSILASRRYITIDYLGEDTSDIEQANDTAKHYLTLLPALAQLAPTAEDTGTPRSIEVSLKLSALGQFLPRDGHKIATDNAHKICSAAEQAGAWVTIDAEDHTTTDSTLSIVAELRQEFPSLGTVLQAYLRRTEGDCHDLSGPGLRICLQAWRTRVGGLPGKMTSTRPTYGACVSRWTASYPMVASHDPLIVDAASRTGTISDRGADRFELQCLRHPRRRTATPDQREPAPAGLYPLRPGMVRLLHASARRTPGQPGVLRAVTDLNEIANLGRTFATLETVAWQRLRRSAAPMWCHPMCG
jgi:proline dehydrogenase